MKKKEATAENYILKPKDFPDEVKKAIIDQLNSTFSHGAVNPYAFVNAKLISEKKEPIDWSGNLKKYPKIGPEMNRILLCGFLGPNVKYEELFDPKFNGPLFKPLIENMKKRISSPEEFFQNEKVRTLFTNLISQDLHMPTIHPNIIKENPKVRTAQIRDAIINGKFDPRLLNVAPGPSAEKKLSGGDSHGS